MPKRYLKEFYWKDYAIILVGLTIYAIGLIGFIKPVGIVTGGLTGIALLVEYASGIPLQYTYFLTNCALLFVALKILGVKFLIKTIYGVIVLTSLLTVCQMYITEPIVKNEPLLSGVIGGMLCAPCGAAFPQTPGTVPFPSLSPEAPHPTGTAKDKQAPNPGNL